MASAISIDFGRLTRELGIDQDKIARTVALLDDGNTVPFITRYRRDQTGGLDEEQIGRIRESITKLRLLDDRKQTILRSIESQHALTDELREQIARADSVKRLEDLYLPYRPKKQTLATKAHEQGLAPLAKEILTQDKAAADLDKRAADFINTDKGIPDAATALLGAGHILAEQFSEDPEVRQKVRKLYRKTGKLVSAKLEDNPKKNQQFHDYLDFREPLSRIPPHRVLAINRGERAKVLRVQVEADAAAIEAAWHRTIGAARACAQGFSDGLRSRCARAADSAEPRARSPSRTDRKGGDARRRGVCPQLAESCCCSRRCRAAACWRSIPVTRTAASWRRSMNSASCSRTT